MDATYPIQRRAVTLPFGYMAIDAGLGHAYAVIMRTMQPLTRWNLVVSRDTDVALRQFLASQGRARKGELSRFVEEAVQACVLELEADQAKRRNAGSSPKAIEDAVDAALKWARHV